jgi:DNA-binding transcriptional LysR family regulator
MWVGICKPGQTQESPVSCFSPFSLKVVWSIYDVLGREHLKRDVALNLPHWLIVPHALERTDFVSVMPGRFAKAIGGETLIARDLPFASEPFSWALYWHRRHNGNPANRWLRTRMLELSKRLR